MAPASDRFICHKVQQVISVCVTSTGAPGLGSGRTQSSVGGSGSICLPTSCHLGQSGGEVAGAPMFAGGWANMPWFWDLVAMSSQIPLCLPNLLTQPFNQTPHRNLPNLNLPAWLLEPRLSKNRASLRHWQHKFRPLKEDQPD